jgi:hypothetical protein
VLFTDAEKVADAEKGALEYAGAITDTRATSTTSCSRACDGTTTTSQRVLEAMTGGDSARPILCGLE